MGRGAQGFVMPVKPRTRLGKRRQTVYGWWWNYRASVRYRGPWLHPLPTVWDVLIKGVLHPFEELFPEEALPRAFEGGSTAPATPQGATKGVMAKQYPSLMSWLCDATYEDGTPLGQTCLSFRRQGTMILCQLRIEDQGGLRCEVVDASVERAMGGLEAVLSAPNVPWQMDRYPLGGKPVTGKRR